MDIIPPGSIIGCQPARKNSHKFYDGQDYYLNMDSHMRAVENWDSLIINDFEKLESKKGKSVFTGYVNSYDVDESGGFILKKETPWLFYMSEDNISNFKQNGVLQMCPKHSNHTEPVLSPYVSGHFFFARGKYIEHVSFVEEITFTEEELFMAVRFFTAGYNLYIPSESYVFHRYGRPNRRLIWEDFPEKFYPASEASKNFSVNVLENNIINEKNGLFSERTLEEFEKYASICFKTRNLGSKIVAGDEPSYIN
jgi:GT2 family glycosyltransferase